MATNSSMTSGLIGEMTHQLLPSVPPIATLTLTLLAMAVRGSGHNTMLTSLYSLLYGGCGLVIQLHRTLSRQLCCVLIVASCLGGMFMRKLS